MPPTAPHPREHRDLSIVSCVGDPPKCTQRTFQELLRQIAAEHAREVAELGKLRKQNAALLRQVGKSCNSSDESLHSPPPMCRASSDVALLRPAGKGRKSSEDRTFVRQVVPDRAASADCRLNDKGGATVGASWSMPLPGAVDAPADSRKVSAISLCADEPGDTTPHAISLESETDSLHEPQNFSIKSCWLEEMDSVRVNVAKQRVSMEPTAARITASSAKTESGMLRHFIAYPSSPRRIVWDALGAMLIFYDLFAIPLTLAFHPPESTYTEIADWVTMVFWTLNMFASFLVGFVKDGVTEMSPGKIASQYVRTWLLVDLLVVVPDWVFTMAAMGTSMKTSEGNSVKLLRTLRLIRMVRLLRLFKLRSIVHNLDELIDTEYMSIFASIAKMILLLLVVNHYISCIWFMIGEGSASSAASWITAHGFDTVHWSYQYFTSFHWAITQFTPASMSVQPQNVVERFFAIAVVVFALVGFAYVVGSITGSLTQLRCMTESASKQFWTLRRCLKQNQIPLALSARVQRYLEHRWKREAQAISTDAIPLFSLLSEQLKSELKSAMFVPQLSVHPLLLHLCTNSSVTAGRLAHGALSRKALAQNDYFFLPGEDATHMSFIRVGMLQYSKVNSQGVEEKEWVEKCEDWIAEPVMWLPSWVHLGSLVATMECDLLLLDPDQFCHIVHLNPSVFQLVSTYARNFHLWLNSLQPDNLSDIWQGEFVGPRVRQLMGASSAGNVGLHRGGSLVSDLPSFKLPLPPRRSVSPGKRRFSTAIG